MALKTFRPTTPSLRQLVQVDRSHLWKGAPIKLVVYPGAAHDFGDAALRPLRRHFGHFSAYNRAAADDASIQVRDFLARNK